MRAFPPLFGHGFQLFPDDDSDATPTDSELSCANTSSLDPLWSTDEDDVVVWSDEGDMEGLDEDLREMYGSDVAVWGSSDSSGEESSMSTSEEEEGGRVVRIHYHGGEAGGRGRGRDKIKESASGSGAGVKKEKMRKTVGPSGFQSEPACGSDCGASRSETQPPQPTRSQPSRKAKKATAASASASKENTSSTCTVDVAEKQKRESSSAATGSSSQPKPKKDGGNKSCNSKRCQPKRKVKSAPTHPTAATGCGSNVVEATHSEPLELSSSSSNSIAKPKKSGSGSRTVANGNSSGRGSRAVADGNGETTGGDSGPSQRWIRKRNRRQEEANGTAADSYEQYRAEDFLKAKSPTSFYAKKDPQ
jgi:hypothetical protein